MRQRAFASTLLLVFVAGQAFSNSLLRAAQVREAVGDRDSDGDGLSDFQEVHKYCTNPAKKDTAGSGASDGDRTERRECNYSVRAVVRVMPPYNLAALSDDYQDVRVIAESKEYAELEVVIYPLNTCAGEGVITGNRNWATDYAGMSEYLSPGVTTNWDTSMRDQLLAELLGSGIEPEKLTDKEVVERVSRWMYSRAKHRNMFCTYYVEFPGGRASVLAGLERAFERDKGSPEWSVSEQFANELFGKEMFNRKVYGTCTSAAVAQATVLRALGIPTRMIVAIPVADASDPEQVALVERGIMHHRVRATAMMAMAAAGGSFSAHTFLEVFVGNRWRRLNYNTLGQNVLDSTYLGLMVHVHTFKDLSEAGLAATWGARYALGKREGEFRHANPYKLIAVDDHFGRNAKVANPPADKLEHRQITIDRAYWVDAKDAPEEVRAMASRYGTRAGQFVIHGSEWFENAGSYLQYKLFMDRADTNFILFADNCPDVHCRVSMYYVTDPTKGVRDLGVVIPADQLARMARNRPYSLRPVNSVKEYQWRVKEGITLTRELSRDEKVDAILERLERLEKRIERLEKK